MLKEFKVYFDKNKKLFEKNFKKNFFLEIPSSDNEIMFELLVANY